MPDTPGNRLHESASCAFCRIIRGEEETSLVFEDSLSLAFLDRRPLFPGHCLLVPKEHFETLADLPAPLVGPLFQNAQLLERAIEKGLEADGTFVAINNHISQSVPHVHIHLVPRHRKDDLKGFFWPRQRYSDDIAHRPGTGNPSRGPHQASGSPLAQLGHGRFGSQRGWLGFSISHGATAARVDSVNGTIGWAECASL